MNSKQIRLKRFIAFITPLLMWLLLLFELDFVISRVYGDYDKSWGVLAINTNKSYYLPGEAARIEYAVLDSNGSMVCDADLRLEVIKSERVTVDVLSTEEGSISINPDCRNKKDHENPDYESNYIFPSEGAYSLILTATTSQGAYSAKRAVEVRNDIQLNIERKTFTRIYPKNTYRVDIIAKPQIDFNGIVEDLIPMDFEITGSSLSTVQLHVNTHKKIVWEVRWEKGHEYELTYYYNAPDKSPEFYTLGPLKITENRNVIERLVNKRDTMFEELSPWQIATDDMLNRYSTNCSVYVVKPWLNVANAEGAPNLSSTAALSSFNTTNSSYATISDTPEIQCNSFGARDLGTFNSANIVFSLATEGSNNGDDYIDIDYEIIGGSVYDLTTIVQTPAAGQSNSTNGGYWTYPATNITSWVDVGNTRVHFLGVKISGPDRNDAFLDAVWIEVDYTPRTYTQNDFEWYVTANSVTLSNIWPSGGGDNLLENEIFTQFPATNEALSYGDQVRIQMNFTVGAANLPTTVESFRLQFSGSDDCTTATGWTDVGAKASGSVWRLFDEAGLADSTVQVNQISTSDSGTEGYYSEINTTASNPNAVNTTQTTEWDWPVENNGALDNTTYCFRMLLFDGTDFDTYNADSYPKLTTAPGSSNLMRHGGVFQNDLERGHFWAD